MKGQILIEQKKIALFGREVGIGPTDFVLIAADLTFALLAFFFRAKVPLWNYFILKVLVVTGLYFVLVYVAQRISRGILKFLVRVAAVQLFIAHLFTGVYSLQHIFSKGWHDPMILSAERSLFGVQPTVWLQKIVNPWLTEWMMFGYVIYVLLYPLTSAVFYFKRGERSMEDLFFVLAITNVVCYAFFILFPVASPMYQIGHLYRVPLKGYLFTFLGEAIRINIHQAGAGFPSAHCAIATMICWMAWKHDRLTFYILGPIVLSLFAGSVYARFHYVTDVVAGILVAFLLMPVIPLLLKAWNRFAEHRELPDKEDI